MAFDERILTDVLSENTALRLVEPGIYSVCPDIEPAHDYDTGFGNIYDLVACNPVYNRLFWGYSIKNFASVAEAALSSSNTGSVLDLGCGSLAFTAKTYLQNRDRPVVLVDQSIKMLRFAKSRLSKSAGSVPDNMVFLHADATLLPFQKGCFKTILCLNLLHCIQDTKPLLLGLRNLLLRDGKMFFSTLVRSHRLGDSYLKALAKADKLIDRSIEDHQAVFSELGMSIQYTVMGNMAFIYFN